MLYRGGYQLDEISQRDGVDYCAQVITDNPGAVAVAYWAESTGAITLWSPCSPAVWLRLVNWETFEAWLDAYDCDIASRPMRGGGFMVQLPADGEVFAPLTVRQAVA